MAETQDLASGAITWSDGRTFPGSAALLVDRDGLINERILDGYVVSADQLRILTPFLAAFGGFSRRWSGPIVVISNQACIAKGLLDETGLRAIMRSMLGVLRACGIEVTAWYCCPHVDADCCACRKPLPGLLEQCAQVLGIRLDRSVFIGDSPSDVEAGRAVGCRTFLVDPAKPETFAAAAQFAVSVLPA